MKWSDVAPSIYICDFTHCKLSMFESEFQITFGIPDLNKGNPYFRLGTEVILGRKDKEKLDGRFD